MKAIVYNGPRDVAVKDVSDAKIEKPTDVLVRITTTNICGSDLHMYEGRTSFETGRVFGHENLGEVIEVGAGVDRVKIGDRVCLPFNIGCGFCENCEKGLTGFCLTANPGSAGAAYGFAEMGPYQGGQAELLRVPYADFNCLVLPEDAQEREDDYVMLSDIFPTGWHATELAGLLPGESIAIYGAGPVGLMAAHSAIIKGASQVFVIDNQPDRLQLAAQLGATPINAVEQRAVEEIMNLTHGKGTDRGCECVGYQCCDKHGHEANYLTMNNLVASTKATGGHRRGWGVCARRSWSEKRTGEGGQDGLRLRCVLVQGPTDPDRSGECKGLQSPPGRAYPSWARQALAYHFPSFEIGRRPRCLQALRCAG